LSITYRKGGKKSLPELKLTGWREGLKKISLTETLKQNTTLSVKEAKDCVDRLLDGEVVIVDLLPTVNLQELVERVTDIGADCKIEDDGNRIA
jgi:ribosomal protein L7/L12